jgi:hypothetical protein
VDRRLCGPQSRSGRRGEITLITIIIIIIIATKSKEVKTGCNPADLLTKIMARKDCFASDDAMMQLALYCEDIPPIL